MKKACGDCNFFDQDFHYCSKKVQEMTKDKNWLDFYQEACQEWKEKEDRCSWQPDKIS